MGRSSAALADAPTGAEETEGQDPEKGKLFEVPRVGIVQDTTDPTLIKLAFAGSIELDRTNKSDMDFYNGLAAGKNHELQVTVFVPGAKNTHRRDAEGDVQAVLQTKSLIVHSVEAA